MLYGLRWNGKGYDNNFNIVYELRNGKGYVRVYYNSGSIYFEWEYINGQRNGKIKEYYWDWKLEFEGKCLIMKKIEKVKNIIKMVD